MKRFLSLGLSFVLMCSLCTFPAYAASGSLSNFQKSNIYTQGQYTDVPSTNTFASNVKTGFEYGIMQGYGNTFGISNNITRLASIIIASRLNCIYYNGTDNIKSAYSGTTDEIYTSYAKANGIYCNFTDYSKSATRAEFAAILSSALPDEALNAVNAVEDNAIPDVNASNTFATPIYRLYRAGIINGSDSKGTFYPNTNISRGAACAIATRMAISNLRKDFTLSVPLATFKDVTVNNIYSYDASFYNHNVFVVTNTSSATKKITLTVVYKDSAGKIVDTDSDYAYVVGAGQTCSLHSLTDSGFATYDYSIDAAESSNKCYSTVLSGVYNDTSDKFTMAVTNNSNADIEWVEYFILFFNNGKLVDYETGSLNSVNEGCFKAGDTVYNSEDYIEPHTDYQIYYVAYNYNW